MLGKLSRETGSCDWCRMDKVSFPFWTLAFAQNTCLFCSSSHFDRQLPVLIIPHHPTCLTNHLSFDHQQIPIDFDLQAFHSIYFLKVSFEFTSSWNSVYKECLLDFTKLSSPCCHVHCLTPIVLLSTTAKAMFDVGCFTCPP